MTFKDLHKRLKTAPLACLLVMAVAMTAGCGKRAETATDGPDLDAIAQAVQKAQAAKAAEGGNEFTRVMDAAKRGDYQAQRNLAYGFASSPYAGQQKSPVLACAWYLVVLNQGHPQVHDGDVSNVDVYCGKLDAEVFETAKRRATQFLTEITAQK